MGPEARRHAGGGGDRPRAVREPLHQLPVTMLPVRVLPVRVLPVTVWPVIHKCHIDPFSFGSSL